MFTCKRVHLYVVCYSTQRFDDFDESQAIDKDNAGELEFEEFMEAYARSIYLLFKAWIYKINLLIFLKLGKNKHLNIFKARI